MKDYEEKVINIMDSAKDNIKTQIYRAYQQGYEDGKKASCDCKDSMEAEYNRGLNEAWEAAKKIVHDKGLSLQELKQIFNTTKFDRILIENTASEAIAMIKEYEDKQKQDTVQVGDEIVLNGNASHENEKAIILAYDGKSYPYNVLMSNGDSEWIKEDAIECKTGRHFDQISEVLEKMRGESE